MTGTMTNNNFYLRMLRRFLENLLYLLGAIIVTIAFFATVCGDGDKGLFELFK